MGDLINMKRQQSLIVERFIDNVIWLYDIDSKYIKRIKEQLFYCTEKELTVDYILDVVEKIKE